MRSYKVNFYRFKNFYVVRVFYRGRVKDCLQATLQDCYNYVDDLNDGLIRIK